ncbi:hypothetical protein T265_06071 [Opisthorchis viverrini]|uniref:Peptidase S1 domain-containing protein n=1 Tax=Opisthorchis viverrini TaxID=6198 RepID=A0A075AEG9_OPIVI|nr:hypothetical protein T265_06071 [Opisthorchis viverrini]KER26704.1 hypothetical protein T265_06071 [Opisthorchis viverrini]
MVRHTQRMSQSTQLLVLDTFFGGSTRCKTVTDTQTPTHTNFGSQTTIVEHLKASHSTLFENRQDTGRRRRTGFTVIMAGYWETAKNWFYRHYGYQRQTLKPYYEVKEIFMHPEFRELRLHALSIFINKLQNGLYKDIALVYLKESVPFKAVPGFAPLRLPKHTPTGVWPPPGSGLYKDIALVYLKESVPFKAVPGFAPLRLPKHTPTGVWPPPGSGDSGGPLVCPSVDGKEILAGVANSGNLNGPSIFTGASHFRTWIDSVLRYHHTLE